MLSSNILSRMTVRHEIRREYLAIVRGSVQPAEGTISAPLSRKPGSVIERIVDFDHGERAVTHYHVVEEKNGHSLVSLLLETGRTHQIRVHMASIRHPLLGDAVYGPARCPISGLCGQTLHAGILGFITPGPENIWNFQRPCRITLKNSFAP